MSQSISPTNPHQQSSQQSHKHQPSNILYDSPSPSNSISIPHPPINIYTTYRKIRVQNALKQWKQNARQFKHQQNNIPHPGDIADAAQRRERTKKVKSIESALSRETPIQENKLLEQECEHYEQQILDLRNQLDMSPTESHQVTQQYNYQLNHQFGNQQAICLNQSGYDQHHRDLNTLCGSGVQSECCTLQVQMKELELKMNLISQYDEMHFQSLQRIENEIALLYEKVDRLEYPPSRQYFESP